MKKEKFLFLNPSLPIEKRVKDLISRLTLEEKQSQLMHESPAIPRLGIPAYNWWSEALHGVASAGEATIFPQAIGMAATFNPALIEKVASCIGDEARAKFKDAQKRNNTEIFHGLTFWSPNINIFRDPRWGRGQETWGEDPFLTATMGSAFVRGLQGNHKKYLKAAACAKHFAVHSGPEPLRHQFDAKVSLKDLFETYLYAFKVLVENKVEAVMGAYNRTNGEPCCASITLLKKILREKWGFKGHVVSDCGAIDDIHRNHKFTKTPEESVAAAIKAGCDLNCGCTYSYITSAVKQGLLTEEDIDKALTHLLTTRFKLGLFDPPSKVPFTKIPTKIVNCDKHRKLARKTAEESLVLLKNNGILPLNAEKIKKVFVIGPRAEDLDVLYGNYAGVNSHLVTLFEGIVGRLPVGASVHHIDLANPENDMKDTSEWLWKTMVSGADACIAFMGISPKYEGEEGCAFYSDAGGDRKNISLPPQQKYVIKRLKEKGLPVILVLTAGSPLAIPEEHELCDAILYAWYPGEEGGNAVAGAIFGDFSPAGRLPLTFPKSLEDLPPFEDYSMKERTYRYMEKEPLYPFGFGLTYSKIEYLSLVTNKQTLKKEDSISVTVTVKNTGKFLTDEVAQLYLSWPDLNKDKAPLYTLRKFKRITLKPGQKKKISFILKDSDFYLYNENGETYLPQNTRVKLTVGGSLPCKRSIELGSISFQSCEISIL